MTPWNTDAQFAQTVSRDTIFSTRQIDAFLDSYDQFIIVASKGMGKTLLMRVKRSLIEKGKSGEGIILIPKNETSDYVDLPASPGKALVKSMEDPIFWEDLWKLSIAASALLNFPHRISPQEQASINNELARVQLPKVLVDDLTQAFLGRFHEERFPSAVLDMLIQDGKTGVEESRASALHVIHSLYVKYITSGCFVFIDSFDQALSKLFPNNLTIWCAAQHGLLSAAWELSRHNRHVKVFTTIRQEAFASCRDPERNNIRGSVLLIEYSKEHLRNIFTRAVNLYEKKSSIEEFLGLKRVYNGYLRIPEEVFDYIHRHTLGVPRWFMVLGQALSDTLDELPGNTDSAARKLLNRRITEVVNRVSSEQLALEYLRGEMSIFFKGVDPDQFTTELLCKIHSSVVSFPTLKRMAERYREVSSDMGVQHPFCLLFNLGLLGYVDRNAAAEKRMQIFRKPYEFDWNYEETLPRNPHTYYLIHPCLHDLIRRRNYQFSFNRVRIGDGLEWPSSNDERLLEEFVRIFISYAHEDSGIVNGIADVIDQYLNEKARLHDIWFDKWKLKGGRWVQDQIEQGLSYSEFLILVVSKNSLGSDAVAVEWKTKFAEKLSKGVDSVFPLIVDSTKSEDLPAFLQNIYYYRYAGNPDVLRRLVDDILFWKSERMTGLEQERH